VSASIRFAKRNNLSDDTLQRGGGEGPLLTFERLAAQLEKETFRRVHSVLFSDRVPGEAPDKDVLTGLGTQVGQEIFYRVSGILDERLLEEAGFDVELRPLSSLL